MVFTAAVKQQFVDFLGLENRVTSFCGSYLPGNTLGVALYISFQPLRLIGGVTLMLPYYCLLRQLTPSLAPDSRSQYYY